MEVSEEAVLVAREGALDLEYVLIVQHLIKAFYLSQTMKYFAVLLPFSSPSSVDNHLKQIPTV